MITKAAADSPHQYPRYCPALESLSSHLNQLLANRFLVPNTDRAPHFPSHGDLVQLRETRCNQASSVRRFAYMVDLGKVFPFSQTELTCLEYFAHWRLPARWAELGDKQLNHQVCPTPSLRNRTLITRSVTTGRASCVRCREQDSLHAKITPVYLDLQATEHRTLRRARKESSTLYFNMAHNSSIRTNVRQITAGNTGHHSLSTQLQWLWINRAFHSLMAFPHIQDTLQVSGTLRIIPPHPPVTTNPDSPRPNISIRSTQVYHRTAIILEAQIPDRWLLALNHSLLCPQGQFTRHPILRLFQQTHRHIEYYRVQKSQGVLITDVMAANFQPSAIFCVIKERSRALWRKQSVQAVALSSRVPLREIFTLLRENASRPEETHPVARMRYS
ncbi:hypothetical protein BDV11DRAFT_209966 [Aspergillus similis]